MRLLAAALLGFCLAAHATVPHHAVLETSMGDITIELDARSAPGSVGAFAAYARSGTYDNTLFHRVVKGFVVQGGEFANRADTPDLFPVWPTARVAPYPPEAKNGGRNRRGTVALVRRNAAGHGLPPHGFFFNLADNDFLDYRRFDADTRVPTPRGPQVAPAGTEIEGHAVIGRVVSGWDVVERIARVPVTTERAPHEHLPVTRVVLRRVRLLSAQW
ncbi:MAG: peptidylprolyl isomerase [Lysobacter sp.]|nr:peptidylprolyl isomerase [Lysobacter sp.]